MKNFSFVTGVGIFGTVYLTPLFLGRVRGLDAWQIGTALLSAGVFQLIAVPFYGLLANRVDLRWLMMFGLACFGIGMWSFTPLTHDWGWEELLLPHAFRGFAQQFCVAPIVTLTLGMLPPDRLKSASGLFNLMRNLGGAIGIALIDTILEQRTQGHADHLIDQLQAGRIDAAKEVGLPLGRFHDVPLGPIDDITKAIVAPLVKKAALTESFNEAWLIIAALFAISLLALPLMKRAHIPDTAMGPGTEHGFH